MENKKEELDNFCQYINENITGKLAGFLIQFPSSFHCNENTILTNLKKLESLKN